jgi:hypothetical protein
VLTKTARLDATLCFVNEDLELQERIMGEHNGTTAPAAKVSTEKKVTEATKASKKGGSVGADSEEEEEEGAVGFIAEVLMALDEPCAHQRVEGRFAVLHRNALDGLDDDSLQAVLSEDQGEAGALELLAEVPLG